jgi:CheY-like chemotaxis protein
MGSLFKVVLPLSRNERVAIEHAPENSILACKANSKILVVEDNFINQEVIKAIFASIGLSIKLADTGEKALELVEETDFDVVFMDIQLPGIDGNETTRLIKLADTGEKALELVEETDFDVVFMDIQLPGIDGNETTRLIKLKHPDLPIIGLSADAFDQQNPEHFDNQESNNGMVDYLTKPVERQRLIGVLNRFMPPAI